MGGGSRAKRVLSERARAAAAANEAIFNIGRACDQKRRLRGMLMADLAASAGVSLGALRQFLHGRGGTSMAVFFKVAHALGKLDAIEKAMGPIIGRRIYESFEADLGKRARR